MVTVYNVELASDADGVRVAVLVPALYETVAVINVLEALRNSIVEPLIVAAFIASLKMAETVALTDTPVAPFTGLTEVTVGAVISAATVVNDQL